MKKISYKKVKEKGDKYYYTGIECIHGHLSKRRVCDKQCMECKDIYLQTKSSKDSKRRYYEKLVSTDFAKNVYSSAKRSAKTKNIEFSITLEDVKNVYPADGKCPVLGLELKPAIPQIGANSPKANSPSLDRFDPTKGYIKENISVISFRANYLKANASIDELEKIIKWMKLKNGYSKSCRKDTRRYRQIESKNQE